MKGEKMTEKRFKIDNNMSLGEDKIETYELSTLVDAKTKNFYFIVDSLANIESFCERLNELVEENEKLKKENKELRDFEYWVFDSMNRINQDSNDKLDAGGI